jgi:3-oxoacyl-[acyl-carrier-protein] synthase-3
MNELRARLAGCGVAIPPIEIKNDQLARVMETSDRWIRERSGIVTRYFVEPGTGASDLGAAAARAALQDAGIEPDGVDYVICATMTPDHYFPGIGGMVQQRLGMPPVPALDLRQQCAGFVYGMQVVDALIRSGLAETVLLVGTDVHTSLMPFSERTWRVLLGESEESLSAEEWAWNSRFRHLIVLFGDGAGAMVFRAVPAAEECGLLGGQTYVDGDNLEGLFVPGVGSAHRPFVNAAMLEEGGSVPVMDGRAVFKLAVKRMPAITSAALEASGYTLDDLDLLVMHQANLRINEAAQRVLGLSDEHVHNNIQKYGNTTSATLPICFHEARQLGKAPPGSLVAFTALGAGLHWGCMLLRV